MKITLFKNKKGLLHGPEPKRIESDVSGILKIGSAEITVTAGKKEILPNLFYGCTGDYPATFTTAEGEVYELEKVAVRGGWVQPPHPLALELMELRIRTDAAEAQIEELSQIFDTNALNFLIN